VQGFDPVGVCVKDVRESLLVQIRLHPAPHPRAAEVVQQWFEQLENQKLREIEKGMRISESKLREVLAFLRTLDPLPGRSFSRDVTRYVLPDVQVTLHEGEFVIILNDEMIPVLGINPLFEEMTRKKGKDMKTRQFITQNLQDARWFIRTIGQRNETLLKVCRAIVDYQREFFLKGPKYMRPLTLKDIAGEIGVHEATVSRITSSKYMQTEWGIFRLKHFFSNSVAGTVSAGPRFSKEGVKEIIREIIGQEGADAPGAAAAPGARAGGLSDQRIVEILAARGISLARRTVAKYRGELAIESSYSRRRT
jgi:RNA polymerase sigma-54 factor